MLPVLKHFKYHLAFCENVKKGKTSGSRHYRPTPSSAYGIIHLGPIFATRKVVAPFSNIQSSWADQYGSIDTWNIKIRPLVTILWPNILGDQQEPWTPSLLPYLIEITARAGPAHSGSRLKKVAKKGENNVIHNKTKYWY